MAEIYYLSGEKLRLLHALLVTLNLAKKAGPSAELARAYASNSFAAELLGLHRLARTYRGNALATAELINDPITTAWVWGAVGLSALGGGEAERAQNALQQAVAIYQQVGDWQHWGECMAMMAQASYVAGDFQCGHSLWTECYATARSRGDQLQQAWGLNGQAEGLLATGGMEQTDEAILLLRTALGLFTENADKISLGGSYGLLARANCAEATGSWRGRPPRRACN